MCVNIYIYICTIRNVVIQGAVYYRHKGHSDTDADTAATGMGAADMQTNPRRRSLLLPGHTVPTKASVL